MASNSVLQVRLDAHMKDEAESLYKSMGWTLSAAVRCFISQSVSVQGFPFMPETPGKGRGKAFGILSEFADEKKRDLEHDAWITELAAGGRAFTGAQRNNEMRLKKRAIRIENSLEKPRWNEETVMGHPGAKAPGSHRVIHQTHHDAPRLPNSTQRRSSDPSSDK